MFSAPTEVWQTEQAERVIAGEHVLPAPETGKLEQETDASFGDWPWGPFYWTLSPEENALGMEREFAAGPFWEARSSATRQEWFLRPLWADYKHLGEGRHDGHLLTPLYTQRKTPLSYNWNVLLFLQYNRIGALDDLPARTFFVYPFFFWHDDAARPEKSFWGLFPIYGEVHSFFNYRRLFWAPFPLYTHMQAWNGADRIAVPWPFVQIFTNEQKTARGLYVWPLMGHAEYDGHYDRMFWMWPLVYREISEMHKPIPRVRQGFLPFYAFEHSEHVEDISILMFWGWREDTKKEYHETRYLWPLWIQGRSPEQYTNRWAPFYTHSKNARIEKKWWMWPLVQYREVPEQDVMMRRSQFLYFLYWHETQTSIANPELPQASMTFVWPFYAGYDNGAGVTQTQVLSLFEVFFPHNRAMRDTYSPLLALFRSETDAGKGLERWSLLWNLVAQKSLENEDGKRESFHIWPLYHSETTTTETTSEDSFSILYGLLGWRETTDAAPAADAADPAATATPAAAPKTESKSVLTLLWFDIEL